MEEDRQKRNQQRREWHNKMRQVAAEMGVEPMELFPVVSRLQDEKLCRRFIQWLELLFETGYIPDEQYKPLRSQCGAIRRMLIASLNTVKQKS